MAEKNSVGSPYAALMLKKGTKITAKVIQKPPYELNASAPKVLPHANSHIPAAN
jgi:hypothetical protein